MKGTTAKQNALSIQRSLARNFDINLNLNTHHQTVSRSITAYECNSNTERLLTAILVSKSYVPLTIIKGAGHEFIPIPEGESAIVADFHSYVPTPPIFLISLLLFNWSEIRCAFV
jgi:hypothetical protein